MRDKERILRENIIEVGKRLYASGLAVANSGNLSARIDKQNILITASQTSLGRLKNEDIVVVDLPSGKAQGESRQPSSELPLHKLIYDNFSSNVIIHCHPPLINGYFAVCDSLKNLTFESKFYLGEVPVIMQDTPTVTKPQEVVKALKSNNLVVLKYHGSVAIGENFEAALSMTEALEEAVKSAAIARLCNKESYDALDSSLKEKLTQDKKAYPMFSREHIQAIVDLVNKDEFISQKGRELDLTVRLAIKLDSTDRAFTFNFEKGKISSLENHAEAPFVISAPKEVWEQVFLGKLDSFVAVTQGKMKLIGQLGQLSKWYVPFSRLFELFKQVKFK